MLCQFEASLVRVYYNSANELPNFMSIDFGPETNEFTTQHLTVDATGEAKRTDKGPVKCWLEFTDVMVSLFETLIVISRQ